MTYFLLEWGSGDGCDHTIGCNRRITELKVETMKEAETSAKRYLMPDEPEYFDFRCGEACYISRAVIVEVVSEINVEEIYNECRALTAAQKQREKDVEDKAEFERLKKKFD